MKTMEKKLLDNNGRYSSMDNTITHVSSVRGTGNSLVMPAGVRPLPFEAVVAVIHSGATMIDQL